MKTSWKLQDLVDDYVARSAENISSIGIEWERSGIYRDTGKPVAYSGTNGYLAILQKLVEEVGWEIRAEEEGCGILELQRGITRVTIEGDGRLELAGSPQSSLHDLARELRIHNNEVVEMANIFAIGWLPLGVQPLHRDDEIQFAPRERYRIFQTLPGADPALMEMFTKRTNGLTVNVGYKDEESAIRMARAAFRILPIVGAMFSSSSLEAGMPGKFLDMRRWCIRSYCPSRTTIPENILEPDFTLHDWVTHSANVPLVLIKRGDETRAITKPVTFLDWMKNGIDGEHPALEDFDVHVKTTWSDLRLRPAYLEYRVADSVPFRMAMALPALIKGLLLDPENWDRIDEMAKEWTYEDILAADKKALSDGLRARLKGKPLLSYAQDLLNWSNESLHKFKLLDGSGDDESVFLRPIKELVYIEECNAARDILRLWETEWNRNYTNLLQWCEQR